MWETNLSSMKLWFALSFKSDQHQFSPNKISTWSTEKVMGIDKMITRGEMLWSFIILQGNVWSSMRRISVVDPGEASPLIFRPNWGPKGWKKIFLRLPPPLSQGLDDHPPFHYLKVWIWICTSIWGLSRVNGTSSLETQGQSVRLGEKARQKFSSTKCQVKLGTG